MTEGIESGSDSVESVEDTVFATYESLKGDLKEAGKESEQVNQILKDLEEEDGDKALPHVPDLKDDEDGEPVEASKEKEEKAPEVTEEVKPPQSWTAAGKEWFNKQPVEARKELAKRTKELETHTYKVWEEANKIKKNYKDLDETLAPFEREWNLRGFTRAQMVLSLAQSQKMLSQDPEAGLDYIAKSYGTSLEEIVKKRLEQGGEEGRDYGSDAQADAALQQLQNQVQYLQAELAKQNQGQNQARIQSVVSELHSVRDEVDGTGRYVFPELHDRSFALSLGPVYTGLLQSQPGLTPREALVKAYTAMTGKVPNRAQSIPTADRARKASLSVRGGSRPTAARTLDVDPGESTEDTVFRTAREMGLL